MVETEYKDARPPGAISSPLGIYIHVPFCRYHCDYCDFATVTGPEAAGGRHRERYLAAVEREAALRAAEIGPAEVDTVYLGGGTPSLLEPGELRRLIAALETRFAMSHGASVSLEANPDDVVTDRVGGWLDSGVTRVTVGIQSMSGEGLGVLGRPGSEDTVRGALELLRDADFRDVGVDVIFGWPGQRADQLLLELEKVFELEPDHISLYALETTSRTRLVRRIERGDVGRVDGDVQASLYEASRRAAEERGFRRYEISNFARPGHESAHNLKYWSDDSYLGLGMSAASYVEGARWTNPRRLSEYVRWVSQGAVPQREAYDAGVRASEAVVFGLRREKGVDLSRVARRHGSRAVDRLRGVLAGERFRELVRLRGDSAALTERGRLLADELFVELL